MLLKSEVCHGSLCGGTAREQWGYSEVQAWDTLDGILEIFAADDECLK